MLAWRSVTTIIHWFRRDLRVSDNVALHEAYSRGDRLVPFFFWENDLADGPDSAPARTALAKSALGSLARNLEALGHRLVVRRGDPAVELRKLATETGASAVFANRGYEPGDRARDAAVEAALAPSSVPLHTFKDAVVWEGREILTAAGGVYTIFTPYSKAWKARPIPPPRPKLGKAKQSVPPGIASWALPADVVEPRDATGPEAVAGGERAAHRALEAFVEKRVYEYAGTRDFPALDGGTSRLSPHLRQGTIGIRTILARLQAAGESAANDAARKGCETWLTEWVWREFYHQILSNHPQVATRCYRPEYDALEWAGTDAQFDAWRAGRTGYPIVDAAMRCLDQTGWMHNRLRMIASMFLTKDLLVPWQRGERWFMRRLADGDLAANSGGWQWSAGTGTDAAPYFRIFNPATQGRRFDADGEFIRRWIPELASMKGDAVHAPWEEPLAAGRTGYPRPIVDHAVQRGLCLAMFKAARVGL